MQRPASTREHHACSKQKAAATNEAERLCAAEEVELGRSMLRAEVDAGYHAIEAHRRGAQVAMEASLRCEWAVSGLRSPGLLPEQDKFDKRAV